MFRVGTHETDGIGLARKIGKASLLDGFEIGKSDAQHGRDIAKVFADSLARCAQQRTDACVMSRVLCGLIFRSAGIFARLFAHGTLHY